MELVQPAAAFLALRGRILQAGGGGNEFLVIFVKDFQQNLSPSFLHNLPGKLEKVSQFSRMFCAVDFFREELEKKAILAMKALIKPKNKKS